MPEIIYYQETKQFSKDVVQALKGKENARGSMACWWPIFCGAITTADEIMEMFEVKIAQAKRWIKNLREAGLIRTAEKDSKIVEVVPKSKMIHCIVINKKQESAQLDVKTNIHTDILDKDLNSSNIDNISLEHKDKTYKERCIKIDQIATKIANLFSKSTPISALQIYNVLDYHTPEFSAEEIDEFMLINLAKQCKWKYDNPSLRPLGDDGKPDAIKNIIGYFNNAVRNKLHPIASFSNFQRMRTQKVENQEPIKDNQKEKYKQHQEAVLRKVPSDQRKYVQEFFEKAVENEPSCLRVAKNIRDAIESRKLFYGKKEYKIDMDQFCEAVYIAASNDAYRWGYIATTYIRNSKKAGKNIESGQPYVRQNSGVSGWKSTLENEINSAFDGIAG